MAMALQMATLVVALGWGMSTANAAQQPQAGTQPSASVATPRMLFVATHGLAEDDLLAALSLRAPGHPRVGLQSGVVVTTPQRWVYIDVHARESQVALTLILEDGRAFDRTVDVGDASQAARATAVGIANLLVAIEEEQLVADRSEIAPPEPLPTLPSKSAPEPEPERAAEPEPEPELLPRDEPNSVVAPEPQPEAPSPNLELGLSIAGGAALGIGPPDTGSAFLGGLGSLAVGLRWRRGAVLQTEFRLAGRRQELTLLRYRIGLYGGYSLRIHRFELLSKAGLFFEPWQLRGGTQPVVESEGEEAELPNFALGVGLRIEPGLYVQTRRAGVRVFAWGEVAGVGVVDEGLRAVAIEVDGQDSGFRVGGIEAAVGLGVGLWLPVRR